MFSLGNIAEKLSDAIGLPEPIGDVIAGAVDYGTGNYFAMADDAIDLCGEDKGIPGLLGDAENALGMGGATTGGAGGIDFQKILGAIAGGGAPGGELGAAGLGGSDASGLLAGIGAATGGGSAGGLVTPDMLNSFMMLA